MNAKKFYTTHDAADLLECNFTSVIRWLNAGAMGCHRTPGGHRRIPRAELAGFIRKNGYPMPPELADAGPTEQKEVVTMGRLAHNVEYETTYSIKDGPAVAGYILGATEKDLFRWRLFDTKTRKIVGSDSSICELRDRFNLGKFVKLPSTAPRKEVSIPA